MDPALLASLLVALTGAAAVGSILIVTALLASAGGRTSALGYLLGYLAAYAAIGMAVVGAGVDVRDWTSGDAGSLGPIVLVILGAVLCAFGARSGLRPRRDDTFPGAGGRVGILDRATPARAFGMGVVVAVVNVKNLALFLTAIAVLQTSDLDAPAKVAAAPLVALAFCLGPFVPLTIDLAAPARSERTLASLRAWIERHGRRLGTWVPLVVGMLFVARGVRGLA